MSGGLGLVGLPSSRRSQTCNARAHEGRSLWASLQPMCWRVRASSTCVACGTDPTAISASRAPWRNAAGRTSHKSPTQIHHQPSGRQLIPCEALGWGKLFYRIRVMSSANAVRGCLCLGIRLACGSRDSAVQVESGDAVLEHRRHFVPSSVQASPAPPAASGPQDPIRNLLVPMMCATPSCA